MFFGEKCMREINVGKNVGLKMSNLIIIQQYSNKTKQNFSKTLNIIIEEWDKLSVELMKMKRNIDDQNANNYLQESRKATVIRK